ncbi:hypothetical protein LCY76_02330 [Fictibacillus sp. KIGAM418]|uniref:Uncharacterized protein n=1 Tax=Fictibacillus marinisediminis TaxID=2878389 RepID=A0A9X2BDV2_9BACL|nr:hypothetical protein [Fictibacillus marinisediminis]MCK6255462.1 hypothetical protein [Fictibacillus marinisediminis]
MHIHEIIACLEAIYLDYYDGLYNEHQMKFMLKKLYLDSNIPINEWSEILLDAQWKYGTEEDYELKRQQLMEEET